MAEFPAYARVGMLAASFKRSRASGVRRSEFDSGARQQIKIADRVMVTESMSIVLSNSDYTLFKEWLEGDQVDRVGWFEYTPPGTEAAVQARVVNGAIKSETPLGGSLANWRIDLDIEYWSS